MPDNNYTQETLDAWLALTSDQQSAVPVEGTVGLPVLSGSMLPDIPPGSTLLIRAADHRSCRVGDVAVFTEGPYRLVAHRLLLRVGLGSLVFFFQKGDNNPRGGWIRARRICGLAVGLAESASSGSEAADKHSALYKPELVGQSLKGHLRNVLLAWPRRIRDRLQGAD